MEGFYIYWLFYISYREVEVSCVKMNKFKENKFFIIMKEVFVWNFFVENKMKVIVNVISIDSKKSL